MSSLLSLSSENLTRKQESKGQTPLNKALYPTIGRWLAIIKRTKKERKTKTSRCSFSFVQNQLGFEYWGWFYRPIWKREYDQSKRKEKKKRNGVPAESYKVISAANKQPINPVYIQNNKEYKCHTTKCPNWGPSNY